MSNFALFKQIDRNLEDAIGLSVSDFTFSCQRNDEVIDYSETVPRFGIGVLSLIGKDWLAENDNLTVSQTIKIKHPQLLFGEDGVTMPTNIIGIGMHVSSKSSMFQYSKSMSEITSDMDSFEKELVFNFDAGQLRGDTFVELFFYLKELHEKFKLHADFQGMKLSESQISKLKLEVDGSGSTFPIAEFSEKDGPLWKLNMNYIDASEDLFSVDNIRLLLNVEHKLFTQLKDGKTSAIRGLMTEIVSQAMAIIIHKVLIEDENTLNSDGGVLQEGTILAAVDYWVNTFEVQIDDMMSISNSLRGKLEESLSE